MNKENNDLLIKLECKSCGDSFSVCSIGGLLLPWKCSNCGEKTVFKKDDIFVIKKRREIEDDSD